MKTRMNNVELVKQKYNKIKEESTDGAWEHDIVDNKIIKSYYSDNFWPEFGYTKEEAEAEGLVWVDILHPDDVSAVNELFTRHMADPSIEYKIMVRYKHKLYEGYPIWILCRGSTIRDSNGKVVSFLGTHTNITEQINIQNELKKANEVKNEFLSKMSHELRTPLNSILGFAQLLEMSEDKNQIDTYSKYIYQGGVHLLSMINDLLDISRIESGNMRFSIESIDINALIEESLETNSSLLKEKSITVNKFYNKISIFGKCDRIKMKQVFINILSNAIKYNKIKGRIDISMIIKGTNTLRVVVKDTGCGITDSSKLFIPFERIGKENSDILGTGLGLHLAKMYMQKMSGDVTMVDTKVNIGSSFAIDIPLDKPVNIENLQIDKTQLKIPNSKSVLYIEDNFANYTLVENIIRSTWDNVTLVTSSDGKKGYELFKKENFDVVLLDIHLPGMDGEKILKNIISGDKVSDCNIVMISADAYPSTIDKFMGLGANDYVTKPINIKKFIEVLSKYI